MRLSRWETPGSGDFHRKPLQDHQGRLRVTPGPSNGGRGHGQTRPWRLVAMAVMVRKV